MVAGCYPFLQIPIHLFLLLISTCMHAGILYQHFLLQVSHIFVEKERETMKGKNSVW